MGSSFRSLRHIRTIHFDTLSSVIHYVLRDLPIIQSTWAALVKLDTCTRYGKTRGRSCEIGLQFEPGKSYIELNYINCISCVGIFYKLTVYVNDLRIEKYWELI